MFSAGKIKEKDVPPVMTCDDSVPPPLPKKPPPTNRPIKRTRSLRRSNSDVTQQVTKVWAAKDEICGIGPI